MADIRSTSTIAFARLAVTAASAKTIWAKLKTAIKSREKAKKEFAFEPANPLTRMIFHQLDARRIPDGQIDVQYSVTGPKSFEQLEAFVLEGFEETTSSFAVNFRWRGSTAEYTVMFFPMRKQMDVSWTQSDSFTKKPAKSPHWLRFAKIHGIDKELIAIERNGDSIPAIKKDARNFRDDSFALAYEKNLPDATRIVVSCDKKTGKVLLAHTDEPMPSTKEGFKRLKKIIEEISPAKTPWTATISIDLSVSELKEYLEATQSESHVWDNLEYASEKDADAGADGKFDNLKEPKPDPFKPRKREKGETLAYPILVVTPIDDASPGVLLQANMVYCDEGSFIEFVTERDKKWLAIVEEMVGRKLEYLKGDPRKRWGWFR